jgi:hypothetical protein
MRRFNHPGSEAVGVCRHCGRGLCSECIAIVEEAVACRGRCEARVVAIQRMLRANPLVFYTAGRQWRSSGVYVSFVGAVLAVLGGVVLYASDQNETGMLILGGLFLGFGAIMLLRGAVMMRTSRTYKQIAIETSADPSSSAGEEHP